jgi:hypothetical protein
MMPQKRLDVIMFKGILITSYVLGIRLQKSMQVEGAIDSASSAE